MTAHRPRLHRDPPTSPLGDLIAGKIDQAEYRRRVSPKVHRDPPTRQPFTGWESTHDRWSASYLVEPEPPTVPELAHWAATGRPPRRFLPEPLGWDEADDMCPNCVTPWKCNGPHLSDETAYMQRQPLDDLASAWRSCLVRAGLLALALILVGLAAAQLASDVR